MNRKWSMAAILAVLVGLGWYSKDRYCASYPTEPMCASTPAPEPTAEPTAEPTVGPEPQPSPVCPPVGATCGCWHRPPGEEWQQLPPCTEPTPGPTPTATPTPQPSDDCMNEADLVSAPCSGEQFGGAVVAATTKLGRLGPDCKANLKALAAELKRTTGKCTIGGIEAVFIVPRSDGLVEENHACFFGNGSWTNSGRGKFMGCHRISTTTPPPPTPTDGCTSPLPPKVARWNMQFRNRWWDVTPLFYNGEARGWGERIVTGYCNSVGFARQFCPARLDCEEGKDNLKCWERRACEGRGIGNLEDAVPLFRCQNGQPEINPLQPFQARCAPGWIEVCATDGTNCTRETP